MMSASRGAACTLSFPSPPSALIAPLASSLPSLPLQYNLQQMRLPPLWANILSTALPWALALVFFTGTSLNNIITWSSALLFGTLNFVLPIGVYIITERARKHALAAAAAGEAPLPELLALLPPADGCVVAADAASPHVHAHALLHGHAHGHHHGHAAAATATPPVLVVPDVTATAPAAGTAAPGSLNAGLLSRSLPLLSVGRTGSAGPASVGINAGGPGTPSGGHSHSHIHGVGSRSSDALGRTHGGSFAAVADAAGRAVKSLFRSDAEVELALGAVAAAHEAHDRERPRGRRESIENALALGPVIDDLAAEATATAAAIASCGACTPASSHHHLRSGSAHSFAVTAPAGAPGAPAADAALAAATSASSAPIAPIVVPRRVWLQHHRQVHPDSSGRRHSCVETAASPAHSHGPGPGFAGSASPHSRSLVLSRSHGHEHGGASPTAASVAAVGSHGAAAGGRPPIPLRRASSGDNRVDRPSQAPGRQSSLGAHLRSASGGASGPAAASAGPSRGESAFAAELTPLPSAPAVSSVGWAPRAARMSVLVGLVDDGSDDESAMSADKTSVLPLVPSTAAAAAAAAATAVPSATSLAGAEEAAAVRKAFSTVVSRESVGTLQGGAALATGGTGDDGGDNDDDDDGPEDVRDDELAPLLSRCVRPLRLAYWVLAVSIVVSILTFALQVDSTTVPASSSSSGGGGAAANATVAVAELAYDALLGLAAVAVRDVSS